MKKIISTIFLVLIISLVGVSAYFGFKLFEGTPPVIVPEKIPPILGKKGTLKIAIKDENTGLKSIEAIAIQKDKRVVVFKKDYPIENRFLGSGTKSDSFVINVEPASVSITPGKMVIEITVHDASLRNGGKGNEAILKIPLEVDYIPPIVTVLSTAHNVRVGGCGAISFTVNEETVRAGVRIDDFFFPAVKGKDKIYRVLFAIPYNLDKPKKIWVEAEDRAHNVGIGGFYHKILPRRKKTDTIRISDSFLQMKMPEFASRFPEVAADNLVDVFLKVNRELRKKNNRFLLSLSDKSQEHMVWQGPFKRFAGARRAGFADFRHYIYNGKEIDQEYHLGVDIASFAHAKVPAANNGKVIFAGYNGIYGNTVVLDHGGKLLSLYAHLSQIMVTPGQEVKKGDVIGKTGSTGLAGGDHLHYGMILNGFFVNPVQWWDRRWVRDHIINNLSLPKE